MANIVFPIEKSKKLEFQWWRKFLKLGETFLALKSTFKPTIFQNTHKEQEAQRYENKNSELS